MIKVTPSTPADALLSEAHRLRHFIALVEDGHYGKAAERLGMDQPTLSRSIVRLEQAVGAQLLVRSARAVALTPAGAIFEKEARALVAHAQLSGSIVRRVQTGDLGNLRLGFTPVAMFWALPEVIRELRTRYPDVQILMQEAQSYQHVERLREGSIDVAFVNGDVLNQGEFETMVLERARVLAAVPSSWPIAQRKRLKLIDLADMPFVIVPKETSPTTHQATLAACRAAGFAPTIVPGENTEVLSRLGMVASGFGVMLTSEYTRALPVEGVTYVPVVDLPDYLHWQLVMVWDRRAGSALVRTLAEVCSSISRSKRKPPAWRGRSLASS